MNDATARLIGALNTNSMDALEISGSHWRSFGWRTYEIVEFPPFDICSDIKIPKNYDIIFMEQVLEHVTKPQKAVDNIWKMLQPNGYFLVTVPFLLKIHSGPIDCSRWSRDGLINLLSTGGFAYDRITTGSWGNRECVIANFDHWVEFDAEKHSLLNEPEFPIVVWALARK